MTLPAADLAAVDAALAAHGLVREGEPWPVPDSVLNANFKVTASGRTLFVRLYKATRTVEQVRAEHRAVAWAASHGLPVNAPLVDRRGRTFVRAAGRVVAVFPWLEGHTLQRGSIDASGARLLGGLHGRLHATLAAYRDPHLRDRDGDTAWDTDTSILALTRVDDLIRYYPAPPEESLRAQAALRHQLSLLETSTIPRPVSEFDGLSRQPVHGDYHERNVLLDAAGEILAVVDWERVCRAPRVFELLRALDFTGLLASPTLREAYLRAYAGHVRLAAGECTLAPEVWWQSVLHNTWAFTDVFIRGNEAARRFLPEVRPRLERLADPGYRAAITHDLARFAGE